jgi:hypothetical protein
MKADAYPPQKPNPDGWVTLGSAQQAQQDIGSPSKDPLPTDHHKRPRSPSTTPTVLTPETKRHRYDVAMARVAPLAQSAAVTRSVTDVAIVAPQFRVEPIQGQSGTTPVAWPEQGPSPSTPEEIEVDEFDYDDDERLLLSDPETLELWEARTEDEQEQYNFYHGPGKGRGKRSK